MFEVASNAIVLIDSSDGIHEEENAIEIFKRYFGVSACQLTREWAHQQSEWGCYTDQSNCSSDGECIDSNVDKDMSTQVYMSVCPNSNCACMCKGCADLSILHQLRNIDKSKLVQSHNCKERQDCKVLLQKNTIVLVK